MRHVSAISRRPASAVSNIPVGTLIDFIVAMLTALKPILVLKYDTTTSS